MALSFNGLEPVAFGGKDCTPKVNTELQMRLANIKKYDAEAEEILAEAFPDDESYVKKFLHEKMTPLDLQILHAYLIGGEETVRMIRNGVEGKMFEGSDK